MDKESGLIFATVMFFAFVFGSFGFVIGSWAGQYKSDQLHWQELVKRGYAVEVESSAGKGYKWKE